MNDIIIQLFLSFLCVIILSKLALSFLPTAFFSDLPDNDRKIHKKITPRFGGIPLSITIFLFTLYALNFEPIYNWFYCGSFMIFLIGILDDTIGVNWRIKITGQLIIGFVTALSISHQNPSIQFFLLDFSLPPILLAGLIIFWIIGVTNAVNLIDGMDGLAGGLILLIGVGFLGIGYFNDNSFFMSFGAILSASIYGFLYFNSKPAKFFMGDTGSLFLGYLLSVSPILFYFSNGNNFNLDITPFIILLSFIIIETQRVFFHRIIQLKNPMQPDQTHFHHLLLHSCHSYNLTLVIIFYLQSLCVLFTFLVLKISYSTPLMIGYFIVYLSFSCLKQPTFIVVGISKLLRQTGRSYLKKFYSKQITRFKYNKFLLPIYLCVSSITLYSDVHHSSTIFILCTFLALLIFSRYFLKDQNVQHLSIMLFSLTYFFIHYHALDAISFTTFYFVFKPLLFTYIVIYLINYFTTNTAMYSLRHWKNTDLLILASSNLVITLSLFISIPLFLIYIDAFILYCMLRMTAIHSPRKVKVITESKLEKSVIGI